MLKYTMIIEPIPSEEGGGYMALFPDLPGCMSDGETPAEAVVNAQDALECWIEAQVERGSQVPEPNSHQAEILVKLEERDKELADLRKALDDAQRRINELERTSAQGWSARLPRIPARLAYT